MVNQCIINLGLCIINSLNFAYEVTVFQVDTNGSHLKREDKAMMVNNHIKRNLEILAIAANVMGVMILGAFIIFEMSFGFGVISFALSAFALVISCMIGKKMMAVISALIMPVVFVIAIASSINMARFEARQQYPVVPVDEAIIAPNRMMPISNSGSIPNLVYNHTRNGARTYVYFSDGDHSNDEAFNDVLEEVFEEMEAPYNDGGFLTDNTGEYYYPNFSYIHYYDTTKMPTDEVTELLNRFEIDQMPCLVEFKYSLVHNSVVQADVGSLKQFFS